MQHELQRYYGSINTAHFANVDRPNSLNNKDRVPHTAYMLVTLSVKIVLTINK